MSINAKFQRQAADIIIDLLNKEELFARHNVFHMRDGRTIFLFQICSASTGHEICMLQKMIHTNKEKEFHIYFRGKELIWSTDIIEHLINIVFEKSQPMEQQSPTESKVFLIE